jgi:hypothetical protein
MSIEIDHLRSWIGRKDKAQGQGLQLGAEKQRAIHERGLIEKANYRARRGRRLAGLVIVIAPDRPDV